MYGINAERFESFNLTHGSRRAEFNDMRCPNSREDEQGGNERAEFADHDNNHDGAEIIHHCGNAIEPGDRLSDHDKSEHDRKEEEHGKEANPRARDLLKHEWMNNATCDAELRDEYAERDQRKRTQALNREQKAEEFSPDIIRDCSGDRHAQNESHARRIEGAGVSLLHASNVISALRRVKADFVWLLS